MNTTTYNLSPEEKMSVFTSKYRNLESPTRDESQMYEEAPEETVSPTVDTNPEVNMGFETQEEDITTEPEIEEKKESSPKINSLSLGYFDKMFMGTLPDHYIKAQDGSVGLYKDKPDPKTMQRGILKRAEKYKPNNITKEIEDLNFTEEDERYLKLLQHLESGSNYKVVNSAGYMGLYQFGKDALKTVKMKTDDYMQSSANQHVAAIKLKEFNLEKLGLKKYVGKTIGGIVMTENGLAAGQHLGGAGSVKKFVESNGKLISVDGNNVPITAYLNIFR